MLLVANRDEYYARPTMPLHWWSDEDILAGRDQQAGGTWLGVSQSGHLAALTNYRDPHNQRDDAASRGEVVSHFLRTSGTAEDYLNGLRHRAKDDNPFNLLVFDGNRLMGLESRHARILNLPEGVGAVSNADFHAPWPKQIELANCLQQLIRQGRPDDAGLLALLQNRNVAADTALPDTGIGLPLERALSSAFVSLPGYGTRASSVVRVGTSAIEFVEHGFDANGPMQIQRVVLAGK
ncbi:NRDE family protein [Rhodoferax antarcticus]|uniref:NRDE family protein n=1 Tax=Rhodoferax antarcticus TaxID=81479 RepID=UPI0029FF47BB|nr:NRDE family protein [Rhodoferax antarcticus]